MAKHGFRWRALHHPSPGTPPGTLTSPMPSPSTLAPRCQVICYDASGAREQALVTPAEIPRQWDGNLWLDITGVPRSADLECLRQRLGLHPLALEDVVTGALLPKMDDYETVLFVIAVRPQCTAGEVHLEPVDLFLGDRFVVSVHESDETLFAPVRRRLEEHAGHLCENGPAHLFHALLDLVVDHGFPVLDELGEYAEELETALLDSPEPEMLARIHRLKRGLLQLRRELWPMRDMLNRLMLPDTPLLGEGLVPYFKDIHDHVTFQLDLVEVHRDMSTSMLDVYLSSASHRLNEIMRVLTMISTLFIPLTFIAGIYGMNFVVDSDSPWAMPLTHWRYGYPAVLTVMLIVALAMIWFFRRKRWL